MFGEAPFADLPISALGGTLLEVTTIGVTLSMQIGCFHVVAWQEVSDVAATWSAIPATASSWSGVSVTTTIWQEVC